MVAANSRAFVKFTPFLQNKSFVDHVFNYINEEALKEETPDVKIDYDENRITLAELLDYYFMVIDPYAVNQQGNDKGIQYRTGIYYEDEGDREILSREFLRVKESLGVKDLPVELLKVTKPLSGVSNERS